MLANELRQWKYYENQLPMYFKNSYGMIEQFSMLYDILLHLDNLNLDINYALDIFDSNYETFIESQGITGSDILDKLASLFGVSRNFDITYINNENVEESASLSLTNTELIKLIKARIIRNNYAGTYEASRELYDKIQFPVYILQTGTPASAYVYLDTGSAVNISENEQKMFLAGLFTLDSMGITYKMAIGSIVDIAIWDSDTSTRTWDEGVWS